MKYESAGNVGVSMCSLDEVGEGTTLETSGNTKLTDTEKEKFRKQNGFAEWMFNWICKEEVILPTNQIIAMYYLYAPDCYCFYVSNKIKDCVEAFSKWDTFEG